jgi:hypothetical protein
MYALLIGIVYDLLLYLHAEPAPTPSHPPSIKCQHCDPLPSLPHRGHATDAAIRMTRVGTKTLLLMSGMEGWACTPLSAKGGGTLTSGAAASEVGLVNDDATCHDENGPPNNVSPCRGGSPTKSRGGTKRKSPSRGLGGMVLHPLPPPMPPALQSSCSITPPAPPSECRSIYHVGFFGPALTFAAKSMKHTANQLQQWAKEPDLGVKSFVLIQYS